MNTLELAACGPVIPVIVIDRVETPSRWPVPSSLVVCACWR